MTEVRYQIPGVPPQPAKGITAFAPAFIRHAASSAQDYKYAVRGYPGTRAIRQSARQDTQISPDYGDLSSAGSARSSDAPDAIWPNQYYQDRIEEKPGWSNEGRPPVYSPQHPGWTTLLPVPAEDGRAAYLAQSATLNRPGVLQRAGQVNVYPRLYMPPSGTWNG